MKLHNCQFIFDPLANKTARLEAKKRALEDDDEDFDDEEGEGEGEADMKKKEAEIEADKKKKKEAEIDVDKMEISAGQKLLCSFIPKANEFFEDEPENFDETFKYAFDYVISGLLNFTGENIGQSKELECMGIQIVNNMINTTFQNGKILTTWDLSEFMLTENTFDYCDGINQ